MILFQKDLREYSTLSDKIQSLEIALKEANINRESLLKRIEEFEEQSRSDKFLISELTTKVDKQQETIDIQRLKNQSIRKETSMIGLYVEIF